MVEFLIIFLIVDNVLDVEDDCYVLSGMVIQEDGQEVWCGNEGCWILLDDDWCGWWWEVKLEVVYFFGFVVYFLFVVVCLLLDGDFDGVLLGWKFLL